MTTMNDDGDGGGDEEEEQQEEEEDFLLSLLDIRSQRVTRVYAESEVG